MRIRIHKFEVLNYRSCIKTSVFPNPYLSAFIGRNASGKSSILNAIVLLRSISRQRRNRRESDTTPAKSKLNVEFQYGRRLIHFKADVYYTQSEKIRDEVFTAKTQWNFREVTGKDEWVSDPELLPLDFSSYIRTHDAGHFVWRGESALSFTVGRKANWTSAEQKKFEAEQESLRKRLRVSRDISRFLSGLSYYSASQFTDPTRCPVAIEVDDERLLNTTRGIEHRRFLRDLFQVYSKRFKSSEYDEFISVVGKRGLRLVDKIDFRKHELPQSQYEVKVGGKLIKQRSERSLIIPYVHVDGNRLSPNQLSEGTFKTMALLFYLIIDKGSLLLIEEPEVCVHHGLLKSIMDLIKSYSYSKQIIISTHSDFVLDSLDPENIFLVEKDRVNGTRAKAITKALSSRDFSALRNYLAESGNLGEFWRHGGFGHGG